jgi:hypothetical protein
VEDSIRRILLAGIPVMGHLGLTPQSIYKFGTYTVRAKEEQEAKNSATMRNCWMNWAASRLFWRKYPPVSPKKYLKAYQFPPLE